MATILTKKKDTTGAPVAGDLTNSAGGAELAVNTADKRLYTKDSGGNVVEVGTNPGTAVTFTAGTVSAPAITTTGDTNTGVFFPAADTIAFAEGGAEAMRINSDSQVVTTAGTASLPAITTTGDVNTGIFFPAADTIAFAEGGAEAMRITSDGRVAIGSTNAEPFGRGYATTLGVSSSANAALEVNSATGNAAFVELGINGTRQLVVSTDGSVPSVGTIGALPLGFYTNGTERMRIDSSGNVGIGTSSPASATRLTLDYPGFVQMLLRSSGTDRISLYGDASVSAVDGKANPLALYAGSAERMRIDSSGNVGIGTSSPTFFSGGGLQISNSIQANLRLSDTTNSGYNFDLLINETDAYVVNRANGALNFFTNNTERARITSDGDLLVGQTSGTYNIISKAVNTEQGAVILSVERQQTGVSALLCYGVSQTNYNAANAANKMGRDSTTTRSLNAGGTVNASGADYAEYMVKSGDFTIAKGDICGINAEGKLTNVFADAISFVVKSTDPSYVGGDVWGNEDAVGKKPREIEQRVAQFDEDGNEIQPAETDEEFATRQAQYQSELAAWESKFEAERQKVDRIAFSGQVPVNVTGASPGQYIVPVESNGGISAIAVNEADMTMAQYIKAVGKVIAIQADGKAKIIVKVA